MRFFVLQLREAKLILQIDDPRNDDARKMGVEDSRGVSRDEMAAALEEVAAGNVPTDRIALRVLHGEMVNWPFLENDASAAAPAKVEVKAPVPGARPSPSVCDRVCCVAVMPTSSGTAVSWHAGRAARPRACPPGHLKHGKCSSRHQKALSSRLKVSI